MDNEEKEGIPPIPPEIRERIRNLSLKNNDDKEERVQQIANSFHTCARLVNRTEDEKGRISYGVVFEHTIVDGRCTRCGETEETQEEPLPRGSFSIQGATLKVIPK